MKSRKFFRRIPGLLAVSSQALVLTILCCAPSGAFQSLPAAGAGDSASAACASGINTNLNCQTQPGDAPERTEQASPFAAAAVRDAEAGRNLNLLAMPRSGAPLTQGEELRRQPAAVDAAVIEHPTEFQIFAQASAGKLLPIYGSWLFDRVPSTFAPLDHVPIPADYTLGPGDQIELRIWGQINANQRLTVDRQGNIFVPQVGRVNVSGLPFSQLPDRLRTDIGRVFRNFELSVDLGDLRSMEVFVMGHARRPGTYTVSSLSTLVNALFVSGGPSLQGSMRGIQVRRNGAVISTFDFYDLLLKGDKSHDVALKSGDVIFIPTAGPRVAVAGSVETAAIYELSGTSSLRDVLSYAGGLSPVAAGQHAVLERINNRAALVAENLELGNGDLDRTVQDGDIIRLLQVVPQFERSVSLKGNVADPVRLPWHAGMRISDVIPEKRALLTRDYWKERNRLTAGSGAILDENSKSSREASVGATTAEGARSIHRHFESRNDLQPPAPDVNWTYAAIERIDPASLSTKLIPFNLGKVVNDHDAAQDMALEPGDVITIFSSADFVTAQAQQTRLVRIEGEVQRAGTYAVQPGETLHNLLSRAGGLTDKAYVFGSQFTRESTRRQQEQRLSNYVDELEREMDQSAASIASHTFSAEQELSARKAMESQRAALERLRTSTASGRIVLKLTPDSAGIEAFPDMPLENGDRLVIPSLPSTVSVVGTVYNESTFLRTPDLKVSQCLEQAGGPTRYADRSRMFLIHADGSVVSRATHASFNSMPVYPGDTVVVPNNALKTSKLRSFLDASQMVSGLGVSAAAANTMR